MSFEVEQRAKETKKLYEQVRDEIYKVNKQYKDNASKNCTYLEFDLRDLVWLYVRKERFPSKGKRKLMVRGDCPYKIVQMVGDNAYRIELLDEMNISVSLILEISLPPLRMKI